VRIENIQGIIPFTDKKINIDLNGKNLIITGKNGCGKTQLLESIFEVLLQSPTFVAQKKQLLTQVENTKNNNLSSIAAYEKHITQHAKAKEPNIKAIKQLKDQLDSNEVILDEIRVTQVNNEISQHQQQITQYEQSIKQFTQQIEQWNKDITQQEENSITQLLNLRTHKEVVKSLTTKETIISYHESDNVISLLMFFDASRKSGFQPVDNITSLEQETNNIKQQAVQLQHQRGKNSNAGSFIEKYLANWEIKSALRERRKDFSVTEALEAWKEKFVGQLKVLLDNDSTNIKFDDETLNYSISQNHKMDFSFRDLSAGYSSILKVFTELLMTVEVSEFTPENINGFVVIDEVDAHLHPSLQRKVLPFLSELFPKIQFIVSTHSPFVISSESDSVVYDLSTRTLVDDDLTAYSTDVILEGILEVPNYSIYLEKILNNLSDEVFVKENLSLIKDLISKTELLDDESQVQLIAAYSKHKNS
jgi:predicted ATP-binding protein involved in virulence